MTAPATQRLPLLLAIAAALGIAVYATWPAQEEEAPATSAPVPAPPPAPPITVAPTPSPPAPPPPTRPQRGSVPGLSINATFATRAGGGSILVTKADGTRALIVTGMDVAPGTRLTGVAADRAFFLTGGTAFWIPLQSENAAKADPGPATLATAALPAPANAPPTATELRESQLYQAALAASADGPYRGYAVRAQTPLFAKAGLKPGDVITTINGRAFDSPAEIAALSREASLSETVVFTIRRDGKNQELRVNPR